jgi:hypothetical protein
MHWMSPILRAFLTPYFVLNRCALCCPRLVSWNKLWFTKTKKFAVYGS